jgi:hypothetical protein
MEATPYGHNTGRELLVHKDQKPLVTTDRLAANTYADELRRQFPSETYAVLSVGVDAPAQCLTGA